MAALTMEPIGRVKSSRDEAIDDAWDGVTATIELDHTRFTADAVASLTDFSHIEVIFVFDRVEAAEIETGARHPRGRKDWPRVGIFAQRGKGRPNRIGLCVCALTKIEATTLYVRGLDAIDGTPVLDIKPWMNGFGPRGPVREPDWAREIMSTYW